MSGDIVNAAAVAVAEPEDLIAASRALEAAALVRARELGRVYRVYYYYHFGTYVEPFATLPEALTFCEQDNAPVGILYPDGSWWNEYGNPIDMPDLSQFERDGGEQP